MNKLTFATLMAAGALALSCNDKALLDPAFAYPAYAIIDGDTIKTRDDKEKDKKDPNAKKYLYPGAVVGDTVIVYKQAIKTKPTKTPNLAKFKNYELGDFKNQKFKLVAVGGDLTFGMRDGGLYNESILTSYPNLIANQMGAEYKSPLFDANDYNGYGRKSFTTFNPTGGPVPKHKVAINNLAIEGTEYKKYKGVSDTYYMHGSGFGGEKDILSVRQIFTPVFTNEGKGETIGNEIYHRNKKFDFIFVDIGINNTINFSNSMGEIAGLNYEDSSLEDLKKVKAGSDFKIAPINYLGYNGPVFTDFFKLLVSKKLNKGVIINCPYVTELPFYSTDYTPAIQNVIEKYRVAGVYGNLVKDNIVFGSAMIDSIIAPNVNINLKPGINGSIYGRDNNEYSKRFYQRKFDLIMSKEKTAKLNKRVSLLAEYSDMPLVDINALFSKIIKGQFVSHDGIKVDARWPEGNFFSTDGVNPTAFGQVIIANEIIKTMNAFYKMDIELIPTREYLK